MPKKKPSKPSVSEMPEGFIPPDEPIYFLPPGEEEPSITYSLAALAEGRDWSHEMLNVKALHDRGITGKGVVIAILDTGIDNHEDLEGQWAADGNKDFTGSPFGFLDKQQGHGTHVAATAAAAKNDKGLLGVMPDGKVMATKCLNDSGSGASRWIAAAYRWAADHGAHILNASLGGGQRDPETQEAMQYAVSKGCWLVCAAGNSGVREDSWPGHDPNAIAVVALGMDGKRARFSTINQKNWCAAPGVDITAAVPGNRYGTMSGTSMASPAIAGGLALVRGELMRVGAPIPSMAELKKAIAATAKDIPPKGHDEGTGHGILDIAALLDYLMPKTPTPPAGRVMFNVDDLNAGGRAKLAAAGVEGFQLEVVAK